MTATSCNPIGVQIAKDAGLEIDFGKWILASVLPSLVAIGLLPLLIAKIFPPRVGKTPEAPAAARKALAAMGAMSKTEWITAVTFALMVAGWVFGSKLNLNTTSVAFMGFGVLLLAGVITADDIAKQGDTLATFLWLAVLFAMSAQLNELGFMGYVGEKLASSLGGMSWPTLYVTLIALYVFIHYLFVSQTSQVLALFGVFLDVGVRGSVPLPLMSFGLLFASSYFSVISPQGGSQNIIFAASGYLTQRELYKLGLLMTLAFLVVYLVVGSPWVYFVMGR
jgi:DASS family divalent anion:Na+ symporter